MNFLYLRKVVGPRRSLEPSPRRGPFRSLLWDRYLHRTDVGAVSDPSCPGSVRYEAEYGVSLTLSQLHTTEFDDSKTIEQCVVPLIVSFFIRIKNRIFLGPNFLYRNKRLDVKLSSS